MSEHIEFFGAPNDEKARAFHVQGPKRPIKTVSGSFFDADDAIVTWENLLTGRLRKHEATVDDPRMVADMVNDGSAVFALSGELVARLVQADLPRLRDVAKAWRAEVLRNGEDIDADAALGILVGVAGLAREAVQSDGGVYCWVTG